MHNMIVVTLLMVVAVTSGCPTEGTKVEQEELPPQPYSFSYQAGRAPGHVDRVHSETKDESGVVSGSYSYVDPRNKVQTVEYVADAAGVHIQASNLPVDTPEVAAAKARHQAAYDAIAAEHARVPYVEDTAGVDIQARNLPVNIQDSDVPVDTPAVAAAKARHQAEYDAIVAEHARVAAEHERRAAAEAKLAKAIERAKEYQRTSSLG